MSRSNWLQSSVAGVIILCFSAFIYLAGTGGTFNFIEGPLKDMLRAKSSLERQPHDHIKIVTIDTKSLEAIGQFPWQRSIYAELIEKLEQGGVKAVGLDVILAEPGNDPKDDQAMAELLNKYSNIILPVSFNFPAKQEEEGKLVYDKADYPADTIEAGLDQFAHINVFQDKDGKVRKLLVGVPDLQKNSMVPAFSAKLANYLLDREHQIRWDDNSKQWFRGAKIIPVNDRYQVTTEFYSKPRQELEVVTGYDAQSFVDVYNGDIDPAYFQDSVVLIGPYTTGLQDEYLTPESDSIRMFGVEIHANMTQSLWAGKFYTDLGTMGGLLILIIVTLLSVYLFERFRGRAAVFIYLGFIVLYLCIWLLSNIILSVFIPATYPLFAITVIYVGSIVSHYLAERKERGRVTNIFGRFVAKTVVDEMLASGEEVKLGGMRRDITLIFVDIRGFTPMSEKLEPEQVIQVLNEYLDVCTKAIFKFNGTLDKFMGDGVMAMFGAPISFDNHPEMAVHAALEMKKHADVLEQKLIERLGVGVKFGLGINSGPAVVGNIGSEDLRLDYTAIGDTVNLSARLESNAKPGQILISENTYARVKQLFHIEPIGEIKVKGKEQPVMVYEVLGDLQASAQ